MLIICSVKKACYFTLHKLREAKMIIDKLDKKWKIKHKTVRCSSSKSRVLNDLYSEVEFDKILRGGVYTCFISDNNIYVFKNENEL